MVILNQVDAVILLLLKDVTMLFLETGWELLRGADLQVFGSAGGPVT